MNKIRKSVRFSPVFQAGSRKEANLKSAPALLAGLSILLNTLQLLSEYSIDELNQIAAIA
ncbi:hypothetical protein [Acinetobacter sp. TSRC1-2]|uniref:hypothetical protein n=1 Tax=unclassified Acinetobacter TaxID=196816 RepID=UPI003CF6F262